MDFKVTLKNGKEYIFDDVSGYTWQNNNLAIEYTLSSTHYIARFNADCVESIIDLQFDYHIAETDPNKAIEHLEEALEVSSNQFDEELELREKITAIKDNVRNALKKLKGDN